MQNRPYYLGLDIGGTKCAAILGRLSDSSAAKDCPERQPEILDRHVLATRDAASPDEIIDRLVASSRRMCGGLPAGARLCGVGIACGGPLDSRRGLILSPPNLPGWDQIAITDQVSRSLGLPAWLLNDADAGALAEWRFGAGRGCRNLVFLTCGTGFGAGLILDGRLYSGSNDGAGEIGHVRISPTGPVGYGKAGSLEGFCSGGGIAQLGRMRVLEQTQQGVRVAFCDQAGGPEHLSAQIIGAAADAGDPLARRILAEAGEYLGRGLAILVDLLNPERIIIGSVFVRSYAWIWPAAEAVLVQESLSRSYHNCQVVRAELGEKIGDLAALCIALEGSQGGLS